jgi:hypothetical protein
MRPVRPSLRLPLVLALTLAAPALAGTPPKKKVPPKPVAPEVHEAISKALDDAEQKVGGCILEGQGGSVVWNKVVKLSLTLDSAGKLMKAKVAFEPDDVSDSVRTCVDGVLAAVTFPKTNAPLTNIERSWTFSMR